jgi:hypothetical protein
MEDAMDIGEYVERCRELTSYWGTWPLSVKIEPGWIGMWGDDGVLRRVSNLSEVEAMAPPTIITTRSRANEAFYDTGGTTIEARAAADIVLPAPLGASTLATVSFSSSSGVLLAYSDATYRAVQNVPQLQYQIKELAKKGIWEKEWVVVVETVTAKNIVALAAADSNAKIRLALGVDAGNFAPYQLGQVAVGGGFHDSQSMALAATAPSGTPLYRTLRLKKGLLSKLGRVTTTLSGAEYADDPDFLDEPLSDMGAVDV